MAMRIMASGARRELRVASQFEAALNNSNYDPRDEIAEDLRLDDWLEPRQRLVSGFHKVDDDAAVSRP